MIKVRMLLKKILPRLKTWDRHSHPSIHSIAADHKETRELDCHSSSLSLFFRLWLSRLFAKVRKYHPHCAAGHNEAQRG